MSHTDSSNICIKEDVLWQDWGANGFQLPLWATAAAPAADRADKLFKSSGRTAALSCTLQPSQCEYHCYRYFSTPSTSHTYQDTGGSSLQAARLGWSMTVVDTSSSDTEHSHSVTNVTRTEMRTCSKWTTGDQHTLWCSLFLLCSCMSCICQ